MQIALFGGSFDPPHIGHQTVTTQLLQRKIADKVWFVPVQNHPFRKAMSSVQDRLTMLELAIADLPAEVADKTKIEQYEIDRPEVSYSLTTLEALSAKYPQHTFSWVIGSDNLGSFDQWYKFTELLSKFGVFVYPRQGFIPTPLHEGMVFLKDFPKIAVSASEIRQAVHKGESITGKVAPEVEKYIMVHSLYVTHPPSARAHDARDPSVFAPNVSKSP
jgi:nicotinate-nucleotide adenylyltransferase